MFCFSIFSSPNKSFSIFHFPLVSTDGYFKNQNVQNISNTISQYLRCRHPIVGCILHMCLCIYSHLCIDVLWQWMLKKKSWINLFTGLFSVLSLDEVSSELKSSWIEWVKAEVSYLPQIHSVVPTVCVTFIFYIIYNLISFIPVGFWVHNLNLLFISLLLIY